MEKNIGTHAKLSRTKELGGKTGVLVGMDLPLASGGTETGIPPESEEKHLRLRVK